MAVGLHDVNKSNITPGETALVPGCGPIGIAIIATLAARRVESVVVSDFSPKRRELATAVGVHQTLDPAQGSPFDTAGGGVRGGRDAREAGCGALHAFAMNFRVIATRDAMLCWRSPGGSRR